MCKVNVQGAAFGDMLKRTNSELYKKVERFSKFFDNFDDFFKELCEYYDDFKEFYDFEEGLDEDWREAHGFSKLVEEHVNGLAERIGKLAESKDAKADESKDAEALQLMEAAAAKRDAEVDAALAAAAAKDKAKDSLKGLAEESIANREEEIIGSHLNDRKSFEAADLDDLPPIHDEILTFEELKAVDGGRTARTFGEWHALNLGVGEALKFLEDGKAPLSVEEWAMLDRGIDIPQIVCSHEANIDEALKALEDRESLSVEDWNRLGRALRVLAKHCKNLAGKGTATKEV